MSEQEFYAWFLESCPSLVKTVFRCMGGRTLEDAEDAVQEVLRQIIEKWDTYGERIYRDAARKVRMREQDGKPGDTLFSYTCISACRLGNASLKRQRELERKWLEWIQAEQEKQLCQQVGKQLPYITSSPFDKIILSRHFKNAGRACRWTNIKPFASNLVLKEKKNR